MYDGRSLPMVSRRASGSYYLCGLGVIRIQDLRVSTVKSTHNAGVLKRHNHNIGSASVPNRREMNPQEAMFVGQIDQRDKAA